MKCPGQDTRKLKVEIVKCKNCGYEVEIFSDEIRRRCPKCKKYVFREICRRKLL
jgi:predicted Zn-ribbon and HTH transcriptional regulator